MSDPSGRHKNWKDYRLDCARLRKQLWDDYLRARYGDITPSPKLENEEYARLVNVYGGYHMGAIRPDAKAQFLGDPAPDENDLDEAAWLRYYERYNSLPADPMLLALIKAMIEDER